VRPSKARPASFNIQTKAVSHYLAQAFIIRHTLVNPALARMSRSFSAGDAGFGDPGFGAARGAVQVFLAIEPGRIHHPIAI
jgi:hypothetical protein